jgi:hypothetical protein
MKFTYKHPKNLIVYGVLRYHIGKEEGQVRLHPTIPRDVVGLDILKDWIVELQDEYTKLHKEVFK